MEKLNSDDFLDHRHCVKCWETEERVKLTRLVPCQHFICPDCFAQIMHLHGKVTGTQSVDPPNQFASIKCPTCGVISGIEQKRSVSRLGSICGESAVGGFVSPDLPCTHPSHPARKCPHCSNLICSDCEKRHKIAVREEIFEMTRKLGTMLPEVRNQVDFRSISQRQDDEIVKLSYFLDERISLIMKTISDHLFVARDVIVEEGRAKLSDEITETRSKYGDFKQTKLVVNDLKNQAVFSATPFNEIISTFQSIKTQLSAVEGFKNENNNVAVSDDQTSTPCLFSDLYNMADNKEFQENLDKFVADLTEKLMRGFNGKKRVEPASKPSPPNNKKGATVVAKPVVQKNGAVFDWEQEETEKKRQETAVISPENLGWGDEEEQVFPIVDEKEPKKPAAENNSDLDWTNESFTPSPPLNNDSTSQQKHVASSGVTQNNDEKNYAFSWEIDENDKKPSKQSSKSATTPLPTVDISIFNETMYSSLKVSRVITEFPTLSAKFMKPTWIAPVPELGPDRFVVVHNQNRITIINGSTFEVANSYRVLLDKEDDYTVLSGDCVYHDGFFYFSDQPRTRIYRLKTADFSKRIVDPARPELFLQMVEKTWGLSIVRSTNELLFCTDSMVMVADLRNPSSLRTLISRPYHFLYLQEVSDNDTWVVFTKKRFVLRKALKIQHGKVDAIFDDSDDRITRKDFGNVRGTAFDPAHNLIVADRERKCIEIFNSKDQGIGKFYPDATIPTFDPCGVVVLPSGAVVVSEFTNSRLLVLKSASV